MNSCGAVELLYIALLGNCCNADCSKPIKMKLTWKTVNCRGCRSVQSQRFSKLLSPLAVNTIKNVAAPHTK
jgi:hypothetical protein